MTDKPWPADSVERRPIVDLIPYARNARTHSPEQVAQIAASMREWGVTTPILVDEQGTIIAGHGRVMAAQKLGLTELPVTVARGWSEAQKRAYVIADNKLALNAGWDRDLLGLEIEELKAAEFDLPLVGFTEGELADLLAPPPDDPGEGQGIYSRKIEAPIYTPSENRPEPHELYDRTKTLALLADIRKADIPPDVAAFLEVAAERHTVLDFHRIADFYAHSGPKVQRLMEASALVIIDFGQAIEHGFVRLSKRLGEIVAEDEAAEAAEDA